MGPATAFSFSVVSAFRRTVVGPAKAGHYEELQTAIAARSVVGYGCDSAAGARSRSNTIIEARSAVSARPIATMFDR